MIYMMQMKLMMIQMMRTDHSVEQWEEEGVVKPFGRFRGFEGGSGEDNTEREHVDEKQGGDANHLYCRPLQYNPVEIDARQTPKMLLKRSWIDPQILDNFQNPQMCFYGLQPKKGVEEKKLGVIRIPAFAISLLLLTCF